MKSVQRRQYTDLMIIIGLSLVIYILGTQYDLAEKVERFCDLYERLELDEWIVVALFLVPASMAYVWRRWNELRSINDELQAANDEIEALRGILPMCCVCKKIRDDEGYWHEVENYFNARLNTSFTHGICSECTEKVYPDLNRILKKSEKTVSDNPDAAHL